MIKRDLLRALEDVDDDEAIVIVDENGGWDNIGNVGIFDGMIGIYIDRELPFSDE